MPMGFAAHWISDFLILPYVFHTKTTFLSLSQSPSLSPLSRTKTSILSFILSCFSLLFYNFQSSLFLSPSFSFAAADPFLFAGSSLSSVEFSPSTLWANTRAWNTGRGWFDAAARSYRCDITLWTVKVSWLIPCVFNIGIVFHACATWFYIQ